MRRIIVIGAGGHAKVVIEAIRAAGMGEIVGLIDSQPSGPAVQEVPILGGDERLPSLRREGVADAVVAIGSNVLREKIGRNLVGLGFSLPAVVHPAALISPSARVGDGAVIMVRAVVGVETTIGPLAIVNTGAVLDHDNVIESAAHIAPGCSLAGNVKVGARTLVGVGSAVRPGITIGSDAVIGAGSAVVAPVASGTIVVGNPARPLTRGSD
jgi:UDP-perosamine 4-acetyltransferase